MDPDPTPTPAPAPPRRQSKTERDERDGIIARLAAKTSRLIHASKLTTAERDRLQAEVTQLKADLARLTALADNPQRERADRLEGQLREVRHKDVFAKLVRLAGADVDLVDDLWLIAVSQGYKSEAETPDSAAIQAIVDGLKTTRARFFVPATTPTPAPAPEPKPGPAGGRGGPAPIPRMEDGIDESALQALMKDPVASYNNQDKISHWLKNGLVRRGQ